MRRPAETGTGRTCAQGRAAHGRKSPRQRRHSASRLADARFPRLRSRCARRRASRGIGDTHVLGPFLRDVEKLNSEQRNFRVFGPDETLSNGLEAVFEATNRQWDAATVPNDEFLAPTGRVMEMLSEHQCEGWLEGYLLTGRHGLFNCYEAFIHIIDSMFNQHAKWLKVTCALALAAQDRLAELSAGLARLAAGPQRLHPPGSRVSSTTSSTRRPRSFAFICRRTPTACSR